MKEVKEVIDSDVGHDDMAKVFIIHGMGDMATYGFLSFFIYLQRFCINDQFSYIL